MPDPTTTEPDYDAEMKLPPGMTCSDCAHIKRCLAFGFTSADATLCDFHPSRYRAAIARATQVAK